MDEKRLRELAGLSEGISAPATLSVVTGGPRGSKVEWEIPSHLTKEPFGGSFSVTTKSGNRAVILDQQSIRFNSVLMSITTREKNDEIRNLDQDKKIAAAKGKALEKVSKKFLSDVENILKK